MLMNCLCAVIETWLNGNYIASVGYVEVGIFQ